MKEHYSIKQCDGHLTFKRFYDLSQLLSVLARKKKPQAIWPQPEIHIQAILLSITAPLGSSPEKKKPQAIWPQPEVHIWC